VSTELTWDRDLNPEGLAQTLAFNTESVPVLKRIALVGFELPFAEAAGVSLNNKSIVQSAVYGGQLQTEWKLVEWLKFGAYAAFYNWHNADPVALAVQVANAASPELGLLKLNNNADQNAMVTTTGTFVATGQKVITNSQFASKFGLFDTIARLDIKTPVEKWPLVVLGDFVQNTEAGANVGNILAAPVNTALETFTQSRNAVCNPHQRRGYWLEGRVGRLQEKGDWNFSYTRIFVEREAVLGVFNYTEMRQGSNVSQHRVEAFYQAYKNIQLGFTGLFGRPLVTATSPGPAENLLKRLQFDVIYKF
jgi:Putative porin